jgi:regulator of RNase E activity RraB
MASSVSSERAVSSAGITISKRRNRLRGDIVEALQCLKCIIRRELLFRQPEIIDLEADDLEDILDDKEKDSDGWDCFLDDDAGNYEADDEMLID